MNKKYLVFLYLICSACPACEEANKLEEYIEESYVLENVNGTKNIVGLAFPFYI